jgi:hypothetical protein
VLSEERQAMVTLKGLVLPDRLVELVETGQWRGWLEPATLERIAPGRDLRIELCSSFEMMVRNSQFLGHINTSHPRRWWHPRRTSDDQFRTYLSSNYAPNRADLPWLDEEKSLFIAIGDYGDDTGFALDYRPNPDRPRVVGGFWEGDHPKSWAIVWKRIADSFDEFARSLGF